MTNELLLRKQRKKIPVATIIIFIVLVLISFLELYPLIWMFATSLKKAQNVFDIKLWGDWQWSNYPYLIKNTKFLRGMLNTMIIGVPLIVLNIVTAAVAAYAFAKIKFKGGDTLFFILLVQSVIPFAVTMLPQYVMLEAVHFTDTGPLAYMLPRVAGGIYMIFFFRQYLYGIPDALVESAKIDGAGHLRTCFTIIIPLMVPILVTQAILSFIGYWGDYLGPLIYISKSEWATLTMMIAKFEIGSSSSEAVSVHYQMAGYTIAMLPIFIIFAIFQKHIVNSVVISGMK